MPKRIQLSLYEMTENSGYLEKESEYWNEYSRKRAGVFREGMGVPAVPPGGTDTLRDGRDTLREGRPGKGLAFPGGICYI